MSCKLENHIPETNAIFDSKVQNALTAIGIKGIGLVVSQMESGYGKPIRDTGNLMGSITSEKEGANAVIIGTNVEYAPYVHYGTSKMAGRPFLKDALVNGMEELRKIAEQELSL